MNTNNKQFQMSNEIEAKKELLETDLKNHLEGFEKRRKYNRKKTFVTHILIIVLGGLVTFSTGLAKFNLFGLELNETSQIISMILGVIITGIGTYNSFFNNKRFWVVYTSTTNGLKKIKGDMDFYLAGKPLDEIDMDRLREFKDRIQVVLDETNNEWASVRNS